MYLCIYVSMYLSIYLSIYLCMHACMHACMDVCMYVCMYISTVSDKWVYLRPKHCWDAPGFNQPSGFSQIFPLNPPWVWLPRRSPCSKPPECRCLAPGWWEWEMHFGWAILKITQQKWEPTGSEGQIRPRRRCRCVFCVHALTRTNCNSY